MFLSLFQIWDLNFALGVYRVWALLSRGYGPLVLGNANIDPSSDASSTSGSYIVRYACQTPMHGLTLNRDALVPVSYTHLTLPTKA